MSEDMLTLLSNGLDLVGKRELSRDKLKEFIQKTLEYEVEKTISRRKMVNNKKIEESDINNFPFYIDKANYRCGIFIELTEDNIFTLQDNEGNEIHVRQLYKKDKDKQYVRDENGELVSTGRCLMKIKSRKGFMSFFIGLSKVEAMDEEHFYVLVGGLTQQYETADGEDWHKIKMKDYEYSNRVSYTLNVWQLGETIRTKSGKIKIILPDCNWKEDEKKEE